MNKLKIGDRVQCSRRLIDWFANHQEIWKRPNGVIPDSAWEEIALWIAAKASPRPLIGVVVGFGSEDDRFKKSKRNNVKVLWESTEFSLMVPTSVDYCSERDLVKV